MVTTTLACYCSASEFLLLRKTIHTGPVRGLDFNPLQTNLLSSGATNGEVSSRRLCNWSMLTPFRFISGISRTPASHTPLVLAARSSTRRLPSRGTTTYLISSRRQVALVTLLCGTYAPKREMVALAYSGGAGTGGGSLQGGGAMAIGGRRGMSDVSWHPDNASSVKNHHR